MDEYQLWSSIFFAKIGVPASFSRGNMSNVSNEETVDIDEKRNVQLEKRELNVPKSLKETFQNEERMKKTSSLLFHISVDPTASNAILKHFFSQY